jgi:hypothetical protein
MTVTLKQAKGLREGDIVAAILEDPYGGESHWSIEKHLWIYEPVRAGQVVVFQRLIPKVRIVRNGPWNDGHDQMLLCRTPEGERAWLNIGNARKAKKNNSECRASVCGEEVTA